TRRDELPTDRRLRADRRLPLVGAGLARRIYRLVLHAAARRAERRRTGARPRTRRVLFDRGRGGRDVPPVREQLARARNDVPRGRRRGAPLRLLRDAPRWARPPVPTADPDRRRRARPRRARYARVPPLRLRRGEAVVPARGRTALQRDRRRARAALRERFPDGAR